MSKLFQANVIKKNKGITLLEVLAVLVILSSLYIALSRNTSSGTNKVKEADVQQAFKLYKTDIMQSMNQNVGLPMNGSEINIVGLNQFIDKRYGIESPTNGNGVQVTKLNDPWDKPYRLQAKSISESESMVVIRTSGKNRNTSSATNLFELDVATNIDKDDIIMVAYYLNGKVKYCTRGLDKDDNSVVLSDVSGKKHITGCSSS